jgi:type I restriction enzyme S subunit
MKPFAALDHLVRSLPDGWKTVPLMRVARLVEEQNILGDVPLLSLTIRGELVPRSDEVQPPSGEYLLKYGLVSPGDLVVNPMWLNGGSIGVSKVAGAVSPEYRIYRFTADIDPRFIHHLVRLKHYMDQYRLLVRAETTFDRRVTKEDFRALPLLLPPRSEQTKIADYLDAETARIDGIIERKRSMTDLLAERMHAQVDQVLASLGDGIDMRRIKYLARVNQRSLPETAPPELEIRYADISTVGRGVLVAEPELMEFGVAPSRARRLVRAGDTIISTVRTYLRAVLSIDAELEGLVVSTGFAVLSPNQDVEPRYLAWAIQAGPFIEEIVARSVGISYPTINASEIGALSVPVPTLGRQKQVADFLDEARERLARITSCLDRQVDELREGRQAITTAAVTGAFKIEAVAA